MSAQPAPRTSIAEYLAHERRAEAKSEFFDGEIFAMAGASREHNLLVANLVAALHPQVRRSGCELYPSDMRVRIPATDLFTYPDLVVVCGPPRFDDEHLDTLLNPTLIVEVLSASTEAYDRGQKFAHYRTLASLSDYLLVAQDRVQVEHFLRQTDDRWLLETVERRDQSLTLPAIGSTLALDDVYAGLRDLRPPRLRPVP